MQLFIRSASLLGMAYLVSAGCHAADVAMVRLRAVQGCADGLQAAPTGSDPACV